MCVIYRSFLRGEPSRGRVESNQSGGTEGTRREKKFRLYFFGRIRPKEIPCFKWRGGGKHFLNIFNATECLRLFSGYLKGREKKLTLFVNYLLGHNELV